MHNLNEAFIKNMVDTLKYQYQNTHFCISIHTQRTEDNTHKYNFKLVSKFKLAFFLKIYLLFIYLFYLFLAASGLSCGMRDLP